MIIEGFTWFADIVDKIETKHGVTTSEVENILPEGHFSIKSKKAMLGGKIFIELWGKLTREDIWQYSLFIKRLMRPL